MTDDTLDEDFLFVTVTEDDLATLVDAGSIVIVTGTDHDGRRVTFAGDAREMHHFVEVVVVEGEADAAVSDWQIRSVEAA